MHLRVCRVRREGLHHCLRGGVVQLDGAAGLGHQQVGLQEEDGVGQLGKRQPVAAEQPEGSAVADDQCQD